MRRALAWLTLAPLLPIACGSFGAAPVPDAPEEAGVASEAGADAPPAPIVDGAAPVQMDARVPSECPIVDCPASVPDDDCTDDDCEGDDFTATGGAKRQAGTCKVEATSTGYFESDRPRGDTPSRFVELTFRLISVDSSANAAIAQVFVGASDTARVELVIQNGKLSLCAVTDEGTTCSSSSIDIPQQRRIHFYGVIANTAIVPQTFGVSVDCNDVLYVDVPAPFGGGEDVFARVGCMGAPCSLIVDEIVFFTRPG